MQHILLQVKQNGHDVFAYRTLIIGAVAIIFGHDTFLDMQMNRIYLSSVHRGFVIAIPDFFYIRDISFPEIIESSLQDDLIYLFLKRSNCISMLLCV